MAKKYSAIIRDAFCQYQRIRYGYGRYSVSIGNKFMEIPISGDLFEVPAFAMNKLSYDANDPVEKIVVRLNTRNITTGFRTLNKTLEFTFEEAFEQTRLLKVSENPNYYGTVGAVFNRDFEPIFMCSWMLQRHFRDDLQYYELLYPIIRVSPDCFMNPVTPIDRLVSKKLLVEALDMNALTCSKFLEDQPNYERMDFRPSLKIIIEDFPFPIIEADVPSISTTNKVLLQTIMDNIEDFNYVYD